MRSRWIIGAVVTAALILAACSGSSGSSSSSKAPARTVQVGDTSAAPTVALHVGDRLVVTLHSTYWQLDAPTPSPGPLRVVGAPKATVGANCGHIMGTGCGTVRATYVARSAGPAVVAAHRTTCGEAMRCGPGQTDWSVQVTVTKA